jgi:hypothetical protein
MADPPQHFTINLLPSLFESLALCCESARFENLTDRPAGADGSPCRNFNGEQREMNANSRGDCSDRVEFSKQSQFAAEMGWLPADRHTIGYQNLKVHL